MFRESFGCLHNGAAGHGRAGEDELGPAHRVLAVLLSLAIAGGILATPFALLHLS